VVGRDPPTNKYLVLATPPICALLLLSVFLEIEHFVQEVYFQQYKKKAKTKGNKKCHTETMRGKKKPVQLVHKRTPHVPLRQNVEE
jgi:hypothetical protein